MIKIFKNINIFILIITIIFFISVAYAAVYEIKANEPFGKFMTNFLFVYCVIIILYIGLLSYKELFYKK